jgi:hypothetical protein
MALRPEPTGLSRPAANLSMTTRRLDFDDFDDLIDAWFPLTFALNSLNRGMGLSDLYPFVLSSRAITKLRFVHDVIEQAAARTHHERTEARTNHERVDAAVGPDGNEAPVPPVGPAVQAGPRTDASTNPDRGNGTSDPDRGSPRVDGVGAADAN